MLMRYGWPGNVRQLAGVLFRAALQCDGSSLTAEHFPHIAIQSRYTGRRTDFAPTSQQVQAATKPSPARRACTLYTGDGHLRPLEEIEADIIRLAIGHYRGRMTEVARRLGIGRSTLYRKLGDLGIDTARLRAPRRQRLVAQAAPDLAAPAPSRTRRGRGPSARPARPP